MLQIQAKDYFEGEFELPGDKSVTHRAIMLNAGADGEAVITNALMGEDCLSTCRCMRSLGAEIDIDGTTLRVKGTPRFRRGRELNCGNSGTTIRLLTGFVAGKEIDATLYGDESLSARPMKRVAEPLAMLGAEVRTTDGHAPVIVSPKPLHGADIRISVASAQVKSAILLAGISADGETSVTEPVKSRDHTERMLAAMGADIRVDGNTVTVKRSTLRAIDVCVPSDISSAAYFMALGALKGKTLCKNVGINPTRTGYSKPLICWE
ncbi:MAG: 3-phosphoshikimate 1-carboxyvinyltransferase [Clostridia bacterium]|nr:3-phosphoshikimate 1-carboxyvinyltransferase [Clostridia bacterium]